MLDLLGVNQLIVILAAIASGIGVVWGLIAKSGRDGKKKANEERNAADAQAYTEERKRQDGLDLGVGASDAERIRMFTAIRDRFRTGAD